MWVGTACILAEINDKYDKNSNKFEDRFKQLSGMNQWTEVDFWSQVKLLGDNWMSGQVAKTTPAGYAFLDRWGSARYNTATQLAVLVYDKHTNGDRPSKYSEWARGQMDYLLGKNPLNRSYIVGYSSNSVKFPHHRASSGTTHAEDPSPHKHILYGALVGGPDQSDNHVDVTSDYIYNEVAIDYNAALVGACAGLYRYFGNSSMSVTPNFPPDGRDLGDDNGGGNTPVILYGDLNGDGVVNTIDISLLGRYILEIIDGFSVPLEAADVNGDGDINTQDHTLMTRYLMELITEFPVERNR